MRRLAHASLADVDYRGWGIVAASRFLGRDAVLSTMEKYSREGAWGVSMQVTPHHTVHSISSTLSLALACHGPCIGAGGGPADDASAALAALTLLRRPGLPGLWLLFTGWEPELPGVGEKMAAHGNQCIALAAAVLPTAPRSGASAIHIHGQHAASAASIEDSTRLAMRQVARCTTLFAGSEALPGHDVAARLPLGGDFHMTLALRSAEAAPAGEGKGPTGERTGTTGAIPAPHFAATPGTAVHQPASDSTTTLR